MSTYLGIVSKKIGKKTSKNQNHFLRGFKRSQHFHILAHVVQQFITNCPFDRTPCLKTIKEVGGVENSSHMETKEVQVVSPQLPQQKVEILNVENFPQVHRVVKNLISPLNLSEFPAAGFFIFFFQNWEKITSSPFILNTVQRFKSYSYQNHCTLRLRMRFQ